MSINLYGIVLWQMETYFVNEKREIHTIHGYQEVIEGTHLHAVGHMLKKYLPINLFDIQVRLYKCLKFGQ